MINMQGSEDSSKDLPAAAGTAAVAKTNSTDA